MIKMTKEKLLEFLQSLGLHLIVELFEDDCIILSNIRGLAILIVEGEIRIYQFPHPDELSDDMLNKFLNAVDEELCDDDMVAGIKDFMTQHPLTFQYYGVIVHYARLLGFEEWVYQYQKEIIKL